MMTFKQSHFTLRCATIADVRDLQAIEKSAAKLFTDSHYPQLADFDPKSSQAYGHHFKMGHVVFLATSNPTPVGHDEKIRDIAAGFALTAPLEGGLHLHELSVHEHFQRQGLGSLLLSQVVDYASACGKSFVSLTTYRDIAWNEPFYRRSGFAIAKPSETNESLAQILNKEIQHGANSQTRCVMLRHLSQSKIQTSDFHLKPLQARDR